MTQNISLKVSTPVYRSFRTAQVVGIFDLAVSEKACSEFTVQEPPLDSDWHIGLIVGPSGSGKSTLAGHLFPESIFRGFNWPESQAVIDGFDDHPIKLIVETLTMVGFSSPPSWIKPYSVLSNGEKFRCDLAKAILDSPGDLVAFDEFTSVVDRTVAKVGSAALAKAIHKGRVQKKFVAVSCHYDIIEWLTPDWVVDMATGQVARRKLRRPSIELKIVRTDRTLWPLFARHHYLSGNLNRIAECYCALWEGRPVAFCGVLPLMGRKGRKRISRIVTLPDYQGIGIGSSFLAAIGKHYTNNGYRLNITTSHPAMITHCKNSRHWRVISLTRTAPSMIQFNKKYRGSSGRAVVSFEYNESQT